MEEHKIKIAIIGCRTMGTKHLLTLKDFFSDVVEISGILNSTEKSSKIRAQELNVPFFSSINYITKENTDLAIVSTPASFHEEIALNLINKGIGVLVEKPFAISEQGCRNIIEASKRKKTVLAVGYIETYNPAIIALKKELESKFLVRIRAIRTTNSYASNNDITIIQNLMSHDISVVNYLTGLSVDDISTITTSITPDSTFQTYGAANIHFKNGIDVSLLAKVTPERKLRELEAWDKEGNKYIVDYISSTLHVNNKLVHSGGSSIYEELKDFIKSYTECAEPSVNGKVALDIESMVLKVDESYKALIM